MKRQDDNITMIDSINGNRSDIGSGSSRTADTPTTSNDYDFINQPKNPEWDCLLIACQKGDASAARRILREHPSSNSHANPMGQSALHIAAWWSHFKCVEVLLQSGADAKAMSSFGATPLHECLQSNQVHRSKEKRRRRIECVSLLLQAKADAHTLDELGRAPLECFVLADKDDVADRAEIEELIFANEQATNNPLQTVLQKLNSKESTLEEVDQLWFEMVVPNLDLRSTCTLLSTELLSMTEAWIDREENTSEDNQYHLGCITWVWSNLVELSPGIEYKGDDESIPDLHLDSVLQTTLSRLSIALFNRYEDLYKMKKSSFKESPYLLRDDVTLSSWTKLAILLVRERDDITNADGSSSSSKDWTDFDNIQQTWMTIARRDYFELAQLWWDRLKISPIGAVNRQGMTALQFAARSGHFRMVKWLISHPSLSKDRKTLLHWVENQDHRDHTALDAANANQHEQIVELLQDYTNLICN
jgi:ankyrin repeat protein